ncbi:hypothetical protein NE237_009318 [Protea cynaroides]|uniref:non-specific serine/threonine protein kinase n=1 Tax=Protea cynaroides TaxID=273540 RepID=A0A9Q0R069_9MAGN|nr:hypothetical protein NE237_009318 [Protea cynaroides]
MSEIEQITGDGEPTIGRYEFPIGEYELGGLLGCGASSKVYHGRNIGTEQSVVIKEFSEQKIFTGGLVPRINRQMRRLRRLRHPHIVKLYEFFATKTKIYLVMEFVKGGELFSSVSKGHLNENLTHRYFQQLISAVGYCHSNGFFHTDLKPENLLIDEKGDLKVSDFGLNVITDQIRNDGLLHTLCDTPAYVAPEILANEGYDGAKVDIWSCGVILYVLNVGHLLFNDPNLMTNIFRGQFGCPKWFSPDLRRLLSRLLDTNPETRITIDEILDDPWFKTGGFKETNPETHICIDEILDDPWFKELKIHQDEDDEIKLLNAFHTNSFSPEKEQVTGDGEPVIGKYELHHHWFKKGGFEDWKLFEEEDDFFALKDADKEQQSVKYLNAFDIISSASGFDLSGLFKGSSKQVDGERFVSAETLERIIEKVEEVGNRVGMLVQRKKDWVIAMKGQNHNLKVRIEVYRLTETLVVLEVKKKGGDAGSSEGVWSTKIRPELCSLVYNPCSPR